MTDHVLVTKEAGVLRIIFNRPEKKNALTHAMYAKIADHLAEASEDDSVRVILFAGEGDSFTAGNDLLDFASSSPSAYETSVIRFLKELAVAKKPLVAAVQGNAVGVGLTMLLHCDLVYAEMDSSFKAPFVDLALVPEAASSLLLPKLVGHARAAEIFMLGRPLAAEEAHQLGLVTGLCDTGTVREGALAAAAKLAKKAPTSVQLTKKLMRGDTAFLLDRMDQENRCFAEQLKSPEVAEAIAAFMQKRPPDFG